MKRGFCLFLFCCTFVLILVCAGCTSDQYTPEQQEILDYLAALDYVDVEQMSQDQLQRLFDAGIDGVEAELKSMIEEVLAAQPSDLTLTPTIEYLRGWRCQEGGKSFRIDLTKVSSEEIDEMQSAYQSGGTDQLETYIQDKLDSGCNVLVQDTLAG